MAGLAIKIPKAKLIEELKAAIESKKAKIKEIEAENEVYDKKVEEFVKDVVEDVKKGKATVSMGTSGFYQKSGHSIALTVTFSKEKQFPTRDTKLANGYYGQKTTYENQIKEIENTIKLLLISDQDYVNGTTYKHVLRYL
jgi:chaperonin cofactor prefoldin